MADIEFIIDVVSPNAYLAWYGMKPLLQRTGATLALTPVFLGGMHRLTGNAPPMIRDAEVKGKNEYAMLEMQRFIRDHGLSRFAMNPHFPMNTLGAQRALIVAGESGDDRMLVEALLNAIWERELDVSDAETLASVIAEAGLDPAAIAAASQRPETKQKLIENTEQAVARGVFGVPTFFVGKEMFFGKERLDQIERELSRAQGDALL
jgi:2-hydroxychromene-2-carboxylate isomerase